MGQRWSVTRPVDSEPTFAKLSPDGQVSDQTARLFEPRFDFDSFGLSATIDGEPEWMPDFLEGNFSLRTTATHFVVSSDTIEHTRTWAVSRDWGTIDRIETTDGEHTVLVENSFDENGAPLHSQTWVNGRITQEIRYNEFITGDAMTDGGIVSPADVGVVTGTIVDLCFGDQIDRTIRYWHAERQELLDEDAMWTLYRLGLAAPDPALASQIGVAESARRQFDEHAPYRLSYWKQFTLRYCELHRFDDEQRQKAFTICEGAEEQGRRILTECQGQTGEARRACAERFRRVFDDRLVAGLDRLRTLRQRRIEAVIED